MNPAREILLNKKFYSPYFLKVGKTVSGRGVLVRDEVAKTINFMNFNIAAHKYWGVRGKLCGEPASQPLPSPLRSTAKHIRRKLPNALDGNGKKKPDKKKNNPHSSHVEKGFPPSIKYNNTQDTLLITKSKKKHLKSAELIITKRFLLQSFSMQNEKLFKAFPMQK